MKAAHISAYGPPELLKVIDIDRPPVAPNEVLVKVHYSSVTAADTRIRGAKFPPGFSILGRLALGITKPRNAVLGNSFSGVIKAVGSDVTGYQPGDEVCGMARRAWAEYVVVDQAKGITHKPPTVSHEQAAAAMFGGMTAWFFLKHKADIQPGSRVLVSGAAGVVGTSTVQLARALGADVTGIARRDSIGFVESLGAQRCLPYESNPVESLDERFDVVVDIAGTMSVPDGRRLLEPDGKLVLVTASLLENLPRKNVITGIANPKKDDLNPLLEMIERGDYQPAIDSVFPLADIAAANRRFEEGGKQGVVLVKIGG